MRRPLELLLLGIVLAGGSCFDGPLETWGVQMVRQELCSSCGSEGQECCRAVNCFKTEGWDNGCNDDLICNRARHKESPQGTGVCEKLPPK